jgi:peptidoglycan/xylan/chitin deacetylase (PgdA/CDA1 family)
MGEMFAGEGDGAIPVPGPQRRGDGDFADYVLEAFDWLYREGASAPKMMSVGLHLRIIGRPGRISALERILAAMRSQEGRLDRAT